MNREIVIRLRHYIKYCSFHQCNYRPQPSQACVKNSVLRRRRAWPGGARPGGVHGGENAW